MSSPLVSVCIPAFNSAGRVERSIRSVLAQTYPEMEVIVSDDASSDGTSEALGAIVDPRLRTYVNQSNLGWRGNVRRCYHLAHGEFVTILPDDDYLDPKFVERAVQVFEQFPQVGVWCSGSVIVDEAGCTLGTWTRQNVGYSDPRMFFRSTLAMRDVSAPAESVVRRRCVDEVNGADCYASGWRQLPEIDLYLRIAAAGYGSYAVPEHLSFRTVRAGSLTGAYGNRASVMEDKYGVLHAYGRHEWVDEGLRRATNDALTYEALRRAKDSAVRLRVREAYRLWQTVLANDEGMQPPRGRRFRRALELTALAWRRPHDAAV